jgi:rhodanese-related sulfurtransferase
MDLANRFFLSAADLYSQLGNADAPMLVDVRRDDAFDADTVEIISAIRFLPGEAFLWRGELPKDRCVVLYCQRGTEPSPALATAFREAGIDARILDGGIEKWRSLGLPTRRKLGVTPSQWVTRHRPKVDRIACPWLVRRFIDPEAAFYYLSPAKISAFAAWSGAIPYDVEGAEFGHSGDCCSFDAFLRIFAIADPALNHLALIVRGADTGRPELTPQSPGLFALSHGLSDSFSDDDVQLEHGMVVYDALYAWCRREVGAPLSLPLPRQSAE